MALRDVLVVGGGSIGERHLRCFLNTGKVRASLCDVNADIRERLARQYDIAGVHADYNAVDLSSFDAVVMCTPANLHIAMSRRAVEAGCDVLCEKPLSTSLGGVDELAELIERQGVVFSVAYVLRAMPPMAEVKRRIDTGEIGEVMSVTATSGQHFPTYRPAYREIYYNNRATGGGALQDAVTHGLNFVQWCMGPAASVCCEADHLVLPGVEVEDTASLLLRFANGRAICTMALNQFQTNNDFRYDFAGTEGTLRLESPPMRVGVCKDEQWIWSEARTFERDDFFVFQAEAFLKAMEKGAAPLCTLEEAADTLRTILGALESAEQGGRVSVGRASGGGG
ncbi:MAG: Gfo/Idh/MocA family oxidoreductase [Phycisphaerae bacterium]|nr:Gfo/Idh/MocA family oxidoreductase [Phycisphaerae bacterium]